jgi:hypothetical protein
MGREISPKKWVLEMVGWWNGTRHVGVCSFLGYKEGVFNLWEVSIGSGLGFSLVMGAESRRGSLKSS